MHVHNENREKKFCEQGMETDILQLQCKQVLSR